MTLQTWVKNRWLTKHQRSREEVADLLAIVDRDLADASVDRLSPDWRLSIAYNAALQMATLALAAEGYRPERLRAHERAIQSLRLTIAADNRLVDTLDGVRRKRNLINYERAGATSPSEADEVHRLATRLRADVVKWLIDRHPDLIGDG